MSKFVFFTGDRVEVVESRHGIIRRGRPFKSELCIADVPLEAIHRADHIVWVNDDFDIWVLKHREISYTELPKQLLSGRREDGMLVIPERPEDQPLPAYHELLNHLCDELGVPGSPTFREAVAYVKARLAGR